MDRSAAAQLLTRDTHLRVTGWNSAAGVTITVVMRRVDADGRLTVDEWDLVPTPNRVATVMTRPLAESYLVSVQAYVSAGTVLRGQTFVKAELIEGFTGAIRASSTLLQGYITSAANKSWPGSLLESPLDGAGRLVAFNNNPPGAGVEQGTTVPTNARWRVRSMRFPFTASAAVANRRPVLTIASGGATYWEMQSNVDVTAAQTATYEAAVGQPFLTYTTRAYVLPLPGELVLPAGSTIATVTAGLDAGDTYGNFSILYEEWLDI